MAATDKPYRNQRTLDIVFSVSCVLMLLSVVWMLVADYNREFKAVQRNFRDVESVLNERQMLAQLPDPGDVEAAQQLVADKRKARDDKKEQVKAKDQELTAKRDTATADYRSIKADFDSKSSIYAIEVGERDQEGISRDVHKERSERVEEMSSELRELGDRLSDAQKQVDDLDAQYKREVSVPVADAENELSNAQDALKKLTGNFDRFAKATVQKEWGLGDSFRALPILDAFESPTKIKQIVLADLPIEYGSFKYVTRYDRCTSCHMAIDRAGFDHRTLTKLTLSENEARAARDAAVQATCNDIFAVVGAALPKDAHDKLAALATAVAKGDVVTHVDARAPNAPTPPPATPESTSGTVVKVENDKITVKDADGKETTFTVPADAAVTIDGAADKLENIKPESRVVVLKGDDADPFQVIGAVLSPLRDPDTYGPEVVSAVSDPSIQADLVRVKQENEDFREAQSLPRKLELARRILQERKDKGENLGFEPGDLPSHARTVSLTPGQITQFASHPRLDLFVDSNSPHPSEKFGCTICHAGQGSATDFQLASHTPADTRRQAEWMRDYHWHETSQHDWEFPMLSNRFVESSCLKCHHEVTDLVRQGNKEEAPKLLRGFNLVRENGCFGCHEIAGIKAGREVGPDLRLEPQPALEWLSAGDQDKAKADPTNPPGAYRKVGPSLRRIAEKTNEEWARRWINSPRGFRPDTKMPHFYNLSNDSADGPDALTDDQKDFPAAEIHSIAHYLFSESAAGLKGEDTYRLALELQIQELQDKLRYTPLGEKERKALAEATHRLADLALLSRPPKAGEINSAAAGLRETQDGLLQRYPKQADLEQNIAELETRIVKLLDADLAEGGAVDPALTSAVDAFTKPAARSIELAKKYRTEITQDEVMELAGAKEKPGLIQQRDQAFKSVQDQATPLLQAKAAPLQKALDAAQENVKKAPADKEAKKALDQAKIAAARVQNEIKEVDQASSDLQKAASELTALAADMDKARTSLTTQAKKLEDAGRAVPMAKQLFDMDGEPVALDPLPAQGMERDPAHLAVGRRLFSERGCLACHIHNGVREKGTNPGDPLPVADEAADFAPDLSRVAAKIAPKTGDAKEDAKARRRWVVQWVMNPNIYHPRTRMPITHLKVEEACAVADWLLSQDVKPEELANWKEPETPTPAMLVALARVYLAKAPGMTSAKVDEVLPALKQDGKLEEEKGYSDADVNGLAGDADERVLKGPITQDTLERYIGKKAIGRLGCYGCHDVPGFETAKPIGTALNDWGKKDPERLAFEDGDAFARDHYNIVDARYDAANPSKPNAEFRPKDGKEPYEQLFYDALEHHTREGFLHQKLTEPRSFDYHTRRAWDDRLRMPQFRFGRSRPRPGESDEAYAARKDREEAEAREAVMTFILGLQAEPIPLKYVHTPDADQLAEAQGRKALDKFNCIGCHQVRPGVYELKPSKDSLAGLERAYQDYAGKEAAMDHPFAGHNAWTGVAAPWPDRLAAYATQAHIQTDDKTGRDALNLRLTDALHFTNSDGVARDIPAGDKLNLPPEDVFSESQPYGGALADLLAPYLVQTDKSQFGDLDKARAVLPPPLVREGERVQPKWLYQFLLDPGTIRPQENWMRLRMPKFNMSPDEAMALVNYFGAADKRSNPGAGISYPYLRIEQSDEKFWREENEAYRKRLQEGGAKPEDRAAGVVQTLVKPLQDAQAAAEMAAKDLKGDDLKKKQKEIDDLKARIQKVKDWSGEVAKEASGDEAYDADAYRLVAANPAICIQCHSVGPIKSSAPKGPDLLLSAERLRPEWTVQWIANPTRMFAYNTIMPQNFPNTEKTNYNEYFAGEPLDRARAARDVLVDLPRLQALPANVKTREALTGGK